MHSEKRNCFVSYHHGKDQRFLAEFHQIIGPLRVSDYSLKKDISHLKDAAIYRFIREKMRSCSVTIVLVGERTGHRKWIDWEIWASLRSHQSHGSNHRTFRSNGLLAIFLPTASHSVPERLLDNIHSGYAVCVRWEDLAKDLEDAIAKAYDNRMNRPHLINNSRKRQIKNYFNIFGLKI